MDLSHPHIFEGFATDLQRFWAGLRPIYTFIRCSKMSCQCVREIRCHFVDILQENNPTLRSCSIVHNAWKSAMFWFFSRQKPRLSRGMALFGCPTCISLNRAIPTNHIAVFCHAPRHYDVLPPGVYRGLFGCFRKIIYAEKMDAHWLEYIRQCSPAFGLTYI